MKTRAKLWALGLLVPVAILLILIGHRWLPRFLEQHPSLQKEELVIQRRTHTGERLFRICNGANENVRAVTVYLTNDTFVVGELVPEECWEQSPIDTDLSVEFSVKITGEFASGRLIEDELSSFGFGEQNYFIIRLSQAGKIY